MTRSARKAGLSRRHRFAGRGAFAAVLHASRKLRGATMLVHVAAGAPGVSRLGLSVPKRLVRRSVDRNRLKRIARETFRRHAVRGRGLDIVVTSRQKFSPGAETTWRDDLVTLLDRAAGG